MKDFSQHLLAKRLTSFSIDVSDSLLAFVVIRLVEREVVASLQK